VGQQVGSSEKESYLLILMPVRAKLFRLCILYKNKYGKYLYLNTYTQIHIQAIVAVKFRAAVIMPPWKERLHQYITGIVQSYNHKMLSINTMPDHLHLFFGLRPAQSLSDLMKLVKGESSEWINKQGLTPSVFRWQEGYGAFSYARSQVKIVAKYIEDQEIHHHKKTFLEEYQEFLRKFEIEYDEQYIFKELE